MTDDKLPSAGHEKALRDLWRRTLSQVPTTFGRIAYLASLRDPNSGRYQHFGLAQIYSEEYADQALRQSHTQVFSEWLNYSLEQQKSDLEQYLQSLDANRARVLKTWASLAPYKNLLPAETSEAERQLFLSDLELILELLRNEPSRSWQHPGA